jgi:phosphoglycolate phosphatase
MVYHNIIFDLDGTLIDSARLTAAIIDRMLAERGATQQADRDLIRKMDAVGGQAMIAAALGTHSIDPAREIEEFRARFPPTCPSPAFGKHSRCWTRPA